MPESSALERLRLGRIAYLNTEPFFASDSIRSSAVAVPPRQMYDLAAAGAIDAAPLPCVALADHPELFKQIGNFAIAAAGPVSSVLLRSRVHPSELGTGASIGVTPETATSLRLLKVLLYEHWEITADLFFDPLRPENDAQLVIGDQALREQAAQYPHLVDLGAAWFEYSNSPFVYALWLSGPTAETEALDELADYFSANLARNGADASEIAARRPGLGMTQAAIDVYLTNFSYRLGERERAGLDRFFELDARVKSRSLSR